MISAVRDRNLGKVERTDTVQAGDVHGETIWVGSALVVRVNAAKGAEEVVRRSSMKAVARKSVGALQDLDPARVRHDDSGATHPTI